VYSWSTGSRDYALSVSAQLGDLMGYCTPVWASEYTYRGVLNFRTPIVALKAAVPERTRVFVVRGVIRSDRDIALEPSFVMDNAMPSRPERTGRYRLRGLDALGRTLFLHSFEPAEIDHAPDIGHFLFALPITAAVEDRLARILVVGPSGSASLVPAAASGALSREPPIVRQLTGGLFRVTCGSSARGVLVRDGRSGALLGTAARTSMTVAAAAGTPLDVSCSDAVRSVRWRR